MWMCVDVLGGVCVCVNRKMMFVDVLVCVCVCWCVCVYQQEDDVLDMLAEC